MIDFEKTWLPQILGYCKFLVSDDAVRTAWIEQDRTHTSVEDYDELYEQLFDDLDSDAFLAVLPNFLPTIPKQKVISDFFSSIKTLDVDLKSVLDRKDYEHLLASQQWGAVKNAAQNVITEFSRQVYDTSVIHPPPR